MTPLEWARHFFVRFGWQPDAYLLSQLQRKLETSASSPRVGPDRISPAL